MRFRKLLLWDMKFQARYGFYLLYGFLTVFYILLLVSLPLSWKENAAAILIYSDPAAMGMFFMGALILLEKSQRVTNSIAISPVTVEEYILGKILSIAIISVIVGSILMGQGNSENYFLSSIGVFAGSIIFSLCGIIVGAKIESLNQYIVWTIPFEIVGFVPVILYRIGIMRNHWLLLLHPGCGVMQLIEGNMKMP